MHLKHHIVSKRTNMTKKMMGEGQKRAGARLKGRPLYDNLNTKIVRYSSVLKTTWKKQEKVYANNR